MHYFKKTLVVALVAWSSVCIAHAYVSPGVATGFVNDFANVISEPEQTALESTLSTFAKESSNEISVVTVKTIGDDYIENYAEKLFKEWGIGSSKNDNGILLLLSIDDRKLRIEVGYGLEGAVPDSLADKIIRNEIVPALKNSNYDSAAQNAVAALIAATQDEYVGDTSSTSGYSDLFQVLFFFGIFGLQWLASVLGRTKEWWLGGALGFAGGSGLALMNPFGFSLVTYASIIAGLTAFGAFFDYIVSSTYTHATRHGYDSPWWIGGGSSSDGGFGGFGGGSSGGGGASGSW